MPIQLICLDADDTLWHNQLWFDRSFGAFARLVEAYAPEDEVLRLVDEIEHRNLGAYGYGAKGFILSMLEAATELAGDSLEPATVRAVLALGRDLLAHPFEPL